MTGVAIAAPAGGPDCGSGERRGAAFADGLVDAAGGCGDATNASGPVSAGTAGTGWGVVGNDVSALVSASAAFSRCHRLGSIASRSVIPASGEMISPMYRVNVETNRSRVLGSHSLSGVLRTAQALGLSCGNASGVKWVSP